MFKEINLDAYYEDQQRVNALIGSTSAPVPTTPENISRNRLLRVQAGLRHILTDVIPFLADPAEREEMYLWVNGVFTITLAEECDAKNHSLRCLPVEKSIPDVSHKLDNIRHDAACAEEYARELREFYMTHMDAPIRQENIRAAARLQTLINELYCATCRTRERLSALHNEEGKA
ncbi:hypothetical protein FML41_20905 [Klebsiella michiganensis]|uniref:hypothetical protein n=1 Tax=Klebsiella michiganensis TaxID=1134687 RepID=UPI001CCC7097|nr:hypothetical protein [Klebsiella michiganensis]MBZ7750518.1 hypothetical protein [Klebsiella michiganensis]HBV3455709.1 hypothetical protein [Klebsiella pneumoniae]